MAKPTAPAKTQQLHRTLYLLQATGSAVWRDMRRTNRAFYAHAAAVYFWWHQAEAVTGYLDAEYAKLDATHIAERLRKRSLCLNFMQQIEVISKARLCLSLTAPDDDTTLEEKQQHYEEQRELILDFVNLLNDTMVCEHGKAQLCLYQVE